MRNYLEYEFKFFYDLPRGAEKVKGIRKAIDLALEEDDVQNALRLFYEYFTESVIYDDSYEAILAFPEYTALFEKHPEYWDKAYHELLWVYKWISGNCHEFYQISKEQIDSLLENYGSFCDRFNCNKKTYYKNICGILFAEGMDGEVNGVTFEQSYAHLNRMERDELSDCRACELDTKIKYVLFYHDDIERALSLARPLLTGAMHCTEVPHITYVNFSHYYLTKGDFTEAENYADRAWRLLYRDNAQIVSLAEYVGDILLSYAYSDIRKGLAVFKKSFPLCYNVKNGKMLWKYYYGVYHLMKQREFADKQYVKIVFPDRNADFINDENRYTTVQIKEYAYDKLKFLSDKFDERNGNTLFNDRLSVSYTAQE